MKFEMRRKIDELGRIVVPQDIRDYYGIGDGDTVVLIPIKEGIQVVKTEPFLVGQLPRSITATVDGNGRMVVPAFFRNYYRFSPKDTVSFIPSESCVVMVKAPVGTDFIEKSTC